MEFDFKHITLYPELIEDGLIYLGIGALLVLLSKWLWEHKEARRLRRELERYRQMKEDEE